MNVSDLWHIIPSVQLAADAPEREPTPIQMVGPTGVLSLVGPTSKFGVKGTTSTIKLREMVRQLASDDSVQNALLYWDTPGGQVAGTSELTHDIAALAATKPTFGYASDTLASAGYRALSQVGRIYANEAAFIGSIGTAAALTDTSVVAERAGLKVHDVTTGGVKTSGAFGTAVSPEQLAHAQQLVEAMQQQFNTDVARGRNMSVEQVARLADGRLHVAANAVKLGLIDGVASLESTIKDLQAFSESQVPTSTQKVFAMYANPASNGNGVAALATPMQNAQPQQPEQQFVDLRQAAQPQPVTQPARPQPAQAAQPHDQIASIEAIQQACPGASADFVLMQVKARATIQQAQTAFIAEMNQRVAQLESRNVAPAQPVIAQAAPLQAPIAQPAAQPQQFGNQPIYETGQAAEIAQEAGLAQAWRNTVEQLQTAYLADGKRNPHDAYMEARSMAESMHPGGAAAWNETQQHRPTAGAVTGNIVRTQR